jgi:hemolysin activation/secretion protein
VSFRIGDAACNGAVSFLLLVLFCPVAAAQQPPINIPGTISPGGQRPQEVPALPKKDPGVLSIPPVVERPLGESEGPRVRVAEFDLQIDNMLSGQISDATYGVLDEFLDGRLSVQPDEGFTIGALEAIARKTTDIIRAEGFVLSWAFVPVQEVRDGKVRIRVLTGWLKSVTFEGNERYREKNLQKSFLDVRGRAVKIKDLESAILQLRDYPGLTPSAILSPGEIVGSSDLTVRVQEKPVDWGFTGDNYGQVSTGQFRLRGYVSWNNSFRRGDRVYADVIQTFDPTENLYGSIFYETPVFAPGWLMSLGYSKNQFDITQGLFGENLQGFDGSSDIAAYSFNKSLVRSRTFNFNVAGGLSLKAATFGEPRRPDREDNLTVFSFGIETDVVGETLGNTGINQISLFYYVGVEDFLGSMDKNGDNNSTRQGGLPGQVRYAGGDFDKFVFSYQRLQRVTELHSFLFRGLYQWSDDLLVSLEQVSLGGPFNNRAYQVSEALIDKGGYATLEWIYDIGGIKPFTVIDLNFFMFAEYAGGKRNDPLGGEIVLGLDEAEMSSWGGGFELGHDFKNGGVFFARLDVATPIGNRTASNPRDDEDPRFWGRVGISF